jgi:molybdopterin converting factor small subunit
MAILVSVEVFGALRNQVENSKLQIQLDSKATVADAIVASGFEDRVDLWVLLDGRKVSRDTLLPDGAVLTFFQPVGGG